MACKHVTIIHCRNKLSLCTRLDWSGRFAQLRRALSLIKHALTPVIVSSHSSAHIATLHSFAHSIRSLAHSLTHSLMHTHTHTHTHTMHQVLWEHGKCNNRKLCRPWRIQASIRRVDHRYRRSHRRRTRVQNRGLRRGSWCRPRCEPRFPHVECCFHSL